ncbi:hypothetical protein ACYX7E_04105 [Luteimonas sp. RIT-PG2_3]
MSRLTERSKNLLGAVSLAGLGALGVYLGLNPSDGLPLKTSLASAEGTATEYETYRYGVRFSLDSHPTGFNYLSKGNASDQVAAAIASSSGKTVKVLYDPQSLGGPVYSDRQYFTVFEVVVDDQSVRSYDQVAAAWRADNRVGFWGGWAALLFAVGFGLHSWRSRGAA